MRCDVDDDDDDDEDDDDDDDDDVDDVMMMMTKMMTMMMTMAILQITKHTRSARTLFSFFSAETITHPTMGTKELPRQAVGKRDVPRVFQIHVRGNARRQLALHRVGSV